MNTPQQQLTVGKYRLLRKLATGGMAEVYLAQAAGPAGFQKTCVLKRILPHLAENQQFVEMFLNEARLAALLNHPNIVSIFDLGEASGSYYIAMEFIDGPNLRGLCRKAAEAGRAVPYEVAAKIMAFACEGLGYAHDFSDNGQPLNLIHRDISPDNVMISRSGAVKVVDFGIAKAANQEHLTKTGTLKGKLAYMPPEQLRGKVLDRRADIFALGVVLYEMVAGMKPFDATSEVAAMQAILHDPPKPVFETRPDCPPELSRIIEKALEKDREARYVDCRAFQRDLEQFLMSRGQSVGAYELSQFVSELVPAMQIPQVQRTPLPRQVPPEIAGLMPVEPTMQDPPRGLAPPPVGMEPTLPQAMPPGMMPAGMMPPGMQQPGMMPPGMQQPGYPGMPQQGMMPQGMQPQMQRPYDQAPHMQQPQYRTPPPGYQYPQQPQPQHHLGSHPEMLNAQTMVDDRRSRRPMAQPRQSSNALIYVMGVVVALAVGAGSFFVFKLKKQIDDMPSQPPVAAVPTPAAQPEPPAPKPAMPEPAAPAPSVAVETPPAVPSAPEQVADTKPVETPPAETQPEVEAAPEPEQEPERVATAKGSKKPVKPARGRKTAPEPVQVAMKEPPPPPRETAPAQQTVLIIDAEPRCSVTVNGRSYGQTPAEVTGISGGTHDVVLRNADKGLQRHLSVSVAAGETKREKVTFGSGTIAFRVRPWANVEIDGKAYGTTPLPGAITVYEGEHEVQLTNPELGKQVVRKLWIKPGADEVVKVNLEE